MEALTEEEDTALLIRAGVDLSEPEYVDTGNLLRVIRRLQTRLDRNILDEPYEELRALVSDQFRIEISDGREPKIALVPDSRKKFPWTHFGGSTLEDAFNRALGKLRNPEKDYRAEPTSLDREGTLWLASESSVYGEDHTRKFLRECARSR